MSKDWIDRLKKIEVPSNDLLHGVRRSAYYQLYINEQWEADYDTYEEAETIAYGRAFEGTINIERRKY